MTIQTPRLVPLTRSADDGEAHWVIGGLYSYRALHAETGAYFACEVQAPEGFAIPVHFHDDEEEGFYVAQGEVTILVDETERRLAVGGFALAPRGVRHAFRLESADARLLLLLSPGPKHEALFREMGTPARERVVPPESEPPDPAILTEIAAHHGTRIVGAPLRRQ